MKKILCLYLIFCFLLVLFGLSAPQVFAAGNCTGYAWGENVGWINFNPSGGGVTVADSQLTGYAWGENVGWINMSGVETSWRPGPTPTPQPAPAPEPKPTPEPSPVDTSFVPEGGLIRAIGDIDVYIVKYMGAKKFKRLILSPHVFESYGHLRWGDVKDVNQSIVDAFTTSDMVRATVAGDPRVYRLFPDGDTGTKKWIKTAEAFNRLGYDWDAIYTINETDRDAYVEGTTIE